MEVGLNPETAMSGSGIGGALLALWTKFQHGAFKKAVWTRLDSINEKIEREVDKLNEKVSAHAEFDARTYATRAEISSLRDHIDVKFDQLNTTLLKIAIDGNTRD